MINQSTVNKLWRRNALLDQGLRRLLVRYRLMTKLAAYAAARDYESVDKMLLSWPWMIDSRPRAYYTKDFRKHIVRQYSKAEFGQRAAVLQYYKIDRARVELWLSSGQQQETSPQRDVLDLLPAPIMAEKDTAIVPLTTPPAAAVESLKVLELESDFIEEWE